METRLNDDEIAHALLVHNTWTHDTARSALHRSLQFATFAQAMAVMVQIGIEADKADHHPEWSNVYNRIEIWLTTHDAGGISERDLAMARLIDQIVAPLLGGSDKV